MLLTDFVAVALAGRAAPTSAMAANYAARQHAGDEATLLVDGRRVAATGAALANGVLANAVDFDDGHRLCKGHPGAVVIPAALAVAESVDAAREEVLAAILIGYEIAIRAGLLLHATRAEYHASGAWGALGAAAAASRLLRLDAERTRHALGLAAYHAPIAPIMRSVAEPAMTKDACGWGAATGVSAALLAGEGFTALSSDLVDGIDKASSDLSARWHVEDMYVKPYPCCRWSHPAITAALALRDRHRLDATRIAKVTVRTFAAATRLSRGLPRDTEQAQYNLVWPVAVALAHGRFDVAHVLPGAFADPLAADLVDRIELHIDPDCEAAFPAKRFAEVDVETGDGVSLHSGRTESPGEPDDPGWADIVADKLNRSDRSPPPLEKLLQYAAPEHG